MRKPRGRPEQFPVKFVLGISREMDRAVDEWRRRQPHLPNRSEAIRRLVEHAIGEPKGSDPLVAALVAVWRETADQWIKDQQLVGEEADMVRAAQAEPFGGGPALEWLQHSVSLAVERAVQDRVTQERKGRRARYRAPRPQDLTSKNDG